MSAPARRAGAGRRLEPFDVIVERHGPVLLRFCIARLGPDLGEEACQEALIAAMRNYATLQDPAAVGGWLFAIAHRKIIDIARSAARGPMVDDELAARGAVWDDPAFAGAGEVWPLVAKLPPKQREAIGLRFLGELSHAEIADLMQISEEAARRNVFEGLKRLRKELPDDLGRS